MVAVCVSGSCDVWAGLVARGKLCRNFASHSSGILNPTVAMSRFNCSISSRVIGVLVERYLQASADNFRDQSAELPRVIF